MGAEGLTKGLHDLAPMLEKSKSDEKLEGWKRALFSRLGRYTVYPCGISHSISNFDYHCLVF